MNAYRKYIPNTFILISLAVVALGFVTYGIFYHFKKQKSNPDTNSKKHIEVSYLDSSEQLSQNNLDDHFLDSDNDGAFDWEEKLWPELDPHNPDSDGDGILDGEYIREKKRAFNEERFKEKKEFKKLTETQKIGRGLYKIIALMGQEGSEMTDEQKEQLSESVSQYVAEIPLGSRVYLKEDLTLAQNSKAETQKYKKEMLALFAKYPIYTSEFSLIFEGSKDPQKFVDELYIAQNKYKKYIQNLIEIEVPYTIAKRHLQLLNHASELEGILANLNKAEPDDVLILSSLVQIEKVINGIIDTNKRIQKYFDLVEDASLFTRSKDKS